MNEDPTSQRNAPPTGTSEQQLWHAPACKIRIVSDDDESWFDLDRPYALIGSHRCCDIQVGGSSSIPPVAYFVCCLDDSLEVWPTSAIAFPRWGAIRPDTELLVGQSRITLHHPLVSASDNAPLPYLSETVVETNMTWPGKSIPKSFRRPVTIIGDTHPSVLRLHGRGMRRCHFAAVVASDRLWMVNISAADLPHSERVRCLSKPGESTPIGDVIVEFLSATMRPQPDGAQEPRDLPADRPIAAPQLWQPAADSESTTPPSRPNPPAEKKQELVQPQPAGNKPRKQLNPGALIAAAQPTGVNVDPASGDDAESMDLTDRMVSMEQSRRTHLRLLKLTILSAAFSVAGLLWVILLVKMYVQWFK